MAQYYGILDYKAASPALIATLAATLPQDSRIMQKYLRCKLTLDQTLLALVVDSLMILIWQRTRNGRKGINRPESVYKKLIEEKGEEEFEAFDDPEDYLRWREQKGMSNNGQE